MGNILKSTPKFPRDAAQNRINYEIDGMIERDKKNMMNLKKILLLGAAESGKSTLLKQMRILHADGFSESEIKHQKQVIHSNLIQSMTAMTEAMPLLGTGFHDDPSSTVYAGYIVRCSEERDIVFSEEVHQALDHLWKDGGIQETYRRASEYQLHGSTGYFFKDLDRIAADDFVPATQDILMARARTTGIVELQFWLKTTELRVVDVGGQRSERKKWIHCFDDVSSIIFLASLSEYDQKIREDESTNRVEESMRLFSLISNYDYFMRDYTQIR